MPAYITPIEHTRSAFLKPADGLRFGNFEGVVHLPPPQVSSPRLASQSFSSLNNQQIYKTVCDWYETWRPWQQKVVLCGIVDRCSIRQVDMLATTLEPVRHRDYTVAVKHHYPTTPLKKLPDTKPKKKKKVVKKKAKKDTSTYMKSLNVQNTVTLDGAVTPESVIDSSREDAVRKGTKEIHDKLTKPRQLSTIHQESTQEITDLTQFENVNDFADSIATRILTESIPKTVELFDPTELYAQDLASSILQQSMETVEMYMIEREKSILDKTAKTCLPVESQKADSKDIDRPKSDKVPEILDVREDEKDKKKVSLPKGIVPGKPTHALLPESEPQEKPVDMAVLDKYKKFKPPKGGDRTNAFFKMEGRPKSLVRILIPEDKNSVGDPSVPEPKRSESPQSGVSRSMSVVTRSTLSDMRYKLFGSRALATPDYFRQDGVGKLTGGMLHLRQGGVRRPMGVQSLPLPISKLYKSVKWWTDSSVDGTSLVKAGKGELGHNFKEQLNQIWKWMELWEDYERIALLKELLKLCSPEDLNFFCAHTQQKLRDARDINRLSDKLLLYIFSFIPAHPGLSVVKKVCRRWRYLCATDNLWMIKCHELGLAEGIKNLDQMIVRAKGYRMVIDWKMAYDEIKAITDRVNESKRKKKAKPVTKGRTVEFREELERLKQKDDPTIGQPVKSHSDLVKRSPRPKLVDSSSVSESSLELSPASARPRFTFHNHVHASLGPPRGSLTQEQLHALIKKIVIEPEEKEKERALSRGTPMIVELEVHRGTWSSIRRQERGDDDVSVVSEDLREFDDEYQLIWEKKPVSKVVKSWQEQPVVSTDGGVEVLPQPPEEKFDNLKRVQSVPLPEAGTSILRRKKELADEAAGDDIAYDIRPDLAPAPDILGKAKPHMSLEWHQDKGKDEDDEPRRRAPVFAGEVRSVLRARKLQGHMSGITCIQFDHRRLISAGLDRVIRIWDIRSGRSLHKFFGHKGGIRCLVFSGNELATGSWDTTIQIWDLRNLCRRYILTDHSDSVTCLALNQDFMVSGSMDCTVRVWRRSSYLCCNVLRGHKQGITGLAFDGSHVISASTDRTLRLCNIVTGDCVRTFTGCDEAIFTVAMKGSLILSGDARGRVYFWNKMSGDCEAAIQAHSEPINKLEYRLGRFYTASGDGSIREWDLVTMTSVRLLQGHKGPVKDFKVTGDRMVSCSDDGSIRIWDLFDPRKKTTEEEQIEQLHQDGLTH